MVRSLDVSLKLARGVSSTTTTRRPQCEWCEFLTTMATVVMLAKTHYHALLFDSAM